MRIIALIGCGVPILAVSAAVSYGSIREISKSLAQLPKAKVEVPAQGMPTNAAAFLAFGTSSWAIPKQVALVVPNLVDQSLEMPQSDSPNLPTERVKDFAPTAQDVASTQPRERPDPVVVPKRVRLVKVRQANEQPRIPTQRRVPTTFKMPWQTGVFQ